MADLPGTSGTGGRQGGQYEVAVSVRCRRVTLPVAVIRRCVREVLAAEGCPQALVSIAVVGDVAMRALHDEHMGINEPTDVLSFDLSEDACDGDDGVQLKELDVVVNADEAVRQAGHRAHSAARELLLYIVHGVLHGLGYDDRTAADYARMSSRQRQLWQQLSRAERLI